MTKIVTFWAPTGGVGRSSALLAAARALAEDGMHVGVVDADFECPSLTMQMVGLEDGPGAIDLFIESSVSPEPNANWVLDNAGMYVMHAGLRSRVRMDGRDDTPATYGMRLDLLSYTALTTDPEKCDFLSRGVGAMRASTPGGRSLDCVLMNVQAGLGMFSVELMKRSDAVVVCSRGTTDHGHVVGSVLQNLPEDHKRMTIWGMVPNASFVQDREHPWRDLVHHPLGDLVAIRYDGDVAAGAAVLDGHTIKSVITRILGDGP